MTARPATDLACTWLGVDNTVMYSEIPYLLPLDLRLRRGERSTPLTGLELGSQ